MFSDIAIKVENLSKCYQIYNQPRDRLKQYILPNLQRLASQEPNQYYKEFWAIKNVSFEVNKGETVGIVGRNGSGKSTLLQMICGTLNPTSGSITTHGRIAALLELGSGFNPEFTGRENVYLNGSVLGLSHAEIDTRFADIVAFADIGDFIEQPVKTYSSGMMVRLAFAVAINVDPQILVVDEALSVGDELFQRKCFSRIEAIRKAGATILFVSHSGGTVVELCDRAILLDANELLASGTPKQIVGRYQQLLYAPLEKRAQLRDEIIKELSENKLKNNNENINKQIIEKNIEITEYFDPSLESKSKIIYEPKGATISNCQLLTKNKTPVNNIIFGEKYIFRFEILFSKIYDKTHFSMLIKSSSGIELAGAGFPFTFEKNHDNGLIISFEFVCNLLPGIYFINAGCKGISNNEETFLHRILDTTCFKVLPFEMIGTRAGYFEMIKIIDIERK
jgi:lipopolysaccharide transport system ATP-binding protein